MKNTILMLIALLALSATGCKKEEDGTATMPVQITIEAPSGIQEFKIKQLTIVLKEVNSGQETTETLANLSTTLTLQPGLYDIRVDGVGSYLLDGQSIEGDVSAALQGQQIAAGKTTINIPLFLVDPKADFVIEEVYFAGSAAAGNSIYLGDRYLKIYNNSEQVLYADGLVIATSAFNTGLKESYTPDIMQSAVAVDAIIVIPGSGKEYPVQPGASIVIAETAINHKEYNAGAINLNAADFEIIDADDDEDVDNPAVPNIENLYNKLVINNAGYQAFILARIPTTKAEYLAEHTYDYSYPFIMDDFSFDIEESAYKIPNEWVIDAVNISVQAEFKWVVTDASLDRGWTYCAKFTGDAGRFGKSVRRKVLTTSAANNPILQDTNDSSVDFSPLATPSLKN